MKSILAAVLMMGCASLAFGESLDADRVISETGVRGGLIVHLGCGDGQLIGQLATRSGYLAHGLDRSDENIQAARKTLREQHLQGVASVARLTEPALPYVDNLVNLLIVDDESGVSEPEMLRVVAPGGCMFTRQGKTWHKTSKPRPATIDEWTHDLHDASGNPVSQDTLVGPPRHLQWTAGPLWARSHGWTPSVTAMVSAAGRNFYLVDEAINGFGDEASSRWYLVARDGFSGVLLWKRPVEHWGSFAMSGTPDTGGGISVGRFTMPVNAGKRLVAVGDTVFVTLGATAPVSALDAATGKTRRVFEGTAGADELIYTAGRLIISLNPPLKNRPPVVDKDGFPPPAPGKFVCAVDTKTGELLWRSGPFAGIRSTRSQDPFGRLELAAGDGQVVLLTPDAIHNLAADTGSERWQRKRPVISDQAVKKLGYSGMYDYRLSVLLYHRGVVMLAQPEPNTHHTYHTMPCQLYAFDANDGQPMWHHSFGAWGHQTQPDVFAVGNVVWTHVNADTKFGSVWGRGYKALDSSIVDYRVQAIDLHRGTVEQELATRDIFNVGHHHRCYRNKITSRYLMSSRRGVEFVDLLTGENYQNHWVRSGCLLGNMPCNGLLYTAPHPCGCYIDAKLNGFVALASSAGRQRPTSEMPKARQLEKGPAFGASTNSAQTGAGEWPSFRHDLLRSGATEGMVPAKVSVAWRTKLATAPCALTVAGGRVFTAAVDAHVACALNTSDGTIAWEHVADARILSPPTACGDTVIFGSADGDVICLRSADAALVWRFRAAPRRRLITAFGQLESVWPVPGIGIHEGLCWLAAGRSSYLDGGIRVVALDPAEGRVVHDRMVYSADPKTGKMTPEPDGHAMEGLLNDIPTSDGEDVFLRKTCLTTPNKPPSQSLYSTAGFLDSSWFNRTFWQYGRARSTGQIVLGDGVAYGVEPFAARSRDVVFRPGRDVYHLRCMTLKPRPNRNGKKAGPGIVWDQATGIRVSAMIRAGKTIFVAGPPNSADAAHATDGDSGPAVPGMLAAFDARDGHLLHRMALPAVPVWDGMAAAGGRLFLGLVDGSVVCLK